MESSVTYISSFQENIFVNIKLQDNTKLLLGNIYRSPQSDIHNDIELFNLISKVSSLNISQFVLVGDFNLPDIDWNNWSSNQGSVSSKKFIDVLRDNMLIQHVDIPTRARGSDVPHILDLVITNDSFIDNIDYLAPLGNSDHSLLDITYNSSGFSKVDTKKFNFSKGDYAQIRTDLNIDWDSALLLKSEDIDTMWFTFKNIIHQTIDANIPAVVSFSTWKKRKWKRPLDKRTLALIAEKRRLWKQYIQSQDKDTFRNYRKVTNKVRKCTRNISRSEQCEIAKTVKVNPKKFWNYVNSKRKTKDRIGDLEYVTPTGIKSTANTDEAKADTLNQFFSSVFSHDNDSNYTTLPSKQIVFPMPSITFTHNNIFEKLEKLKVTKSPGVDSLHPRILHEARHELVYPLKCRVFGFSENVKTYSRTMNFVTHDEV